MYEAHFGLSRRPFGETVDPSAFVALASRDAVVRRLRYGLEYGQGPALLFGAPGSGKTLIAKVLATEIGGSSIHLSFPAMPFTKSYTIASEIPKGNVVIYWPTTDGFDVKRARRLSLLASVLNDRLRVKVREEIGGTYSPNAGSNASDTFPGYGYIQAGCGNL